MRLPLLIILLLLSCEVENKFENTLNGFVGKNYNAIIDYWGYPTDIKALPNGNDELYFIRIKELTSPYPDYWDENGKEIPSSCHIWFEVNPEMIIIKYRYEGVYCWED